MKCGNPDNRLTTCLTIFLPYLTLDGYTDWLTCPKMDEFLEELELDTLGEQELRELLVAAGYGTSPEDLCDKPFRPRCHLVRATRYSDGSYPVFYSVP